MRHHTPGAYREGRLQAHMQHISKSAQYFKSTAPENDHIAMPGDRFNDPVQHAHHCITLFLALGIKSFPEGGQAGIFLVEFHISILTEDMADQFSVHKMVA